jgi:hypothetical protein
MPAIAHKVIVDEKGEAQEVILSIETFRHIQEVLGADLEPQEEKDLREALNDSMSANRSAFVSLEDL